MSQQQPPNQSDPFAYRWDGPPPAQPPRQSEPIDYRWQNPSPPSYAPPPQTHQPTKKPKRWPWIIALLAALLIGYLIGASSHSGTSTPAQTIQSTQSATTQQAASAAGASKPAQQKWTTVQTFSGNGAKKTGTFAVPADWKIVWSCKGQDIGGVQSDGLLAVAVYNSDGTMADPAAVNSPCKAGKTTTDVTEEHQAGNVYLDVNAAAMWTLQVQVLK